jgi:hypothetical protein
MLTRRLHVLNPRSAAPEAVPIELSRRILAEALALRTAAECPRLESLAGQLHAVEPVLIQGDAARIAFWLNLYNALILHCLCVRPVSGSILRHRRMFGKVAYEIGGHAYSLNVIEHGLLRANRRPPLGLRKMLRRSDPRLVAAPSRLDPRVHFALNCGARSCPPIRAYKPESLDEQLDDASHAYLESETRLEPDRRRVTLPRLMRLYAADFGDRDEQLRFAARYLPELADWLGERTAGIRVAYGRFDWSVAPVPSA